MIRFVLADDLSGAADSAVHFRGAGPVRLTLSPAEPWAFDRGADIVQVHDTETRNVDPGRARDIVQSISAQLGRRSGPRPALFKKVDSTLRGNVAVELLAAAHALGFSGVVLAPALPGQGRTVVGGRLLVGGVPVSATAVGRDPRQPVTSDAVDEILGIAIRSVGLEELRGGGDFLGSRPAPMVVVDGVEDADLDLVAAALALRPDLLPAGSAGLARAMATLACEPPNSSPGPLASVIVAAGSANPVTREQVRRLQAALPAAVILLDVADQTPAEPAALVAEMGRRAQARLASLPHPAALVATGGDTALACCQAMGEQAMTISGEILPGVPWGSLERSGTTLVTKGGGFGGPDALLEIAHRLLRSLPVAR